MMLILLLPPSCQNNICSFIIVRDVVAVLWLFLWYEVQDCSILTASSTLKWSGHPAKNHHVTRLLCGASLSPDELTVSDHGLSTQRLDSQSQQQQLVIPSPTHTHVHNLNLHICRHGYCKHTHTRCTSSDRPVKTWWNIQWASLWFGFHLSQLFLLPLVCLFAWRDVGIRLLLRACCSPDLLVPAVTALRNWVWASQTFCLSVALCLHQLYCSCK